MVPASASKLPNIAPVQFMKEVVAELKKVTWPTRAETIKLTAVVIAISVIVGLFIGGLDITFLRLTSIVFK
ncbi:preprotein translocase subunit SecE [Candidatus Gottesmanbacteria bacterium RIFCSPHIGHO2_01_FULL_46_14]|uniref:Protein translocase subunit SecE n=2 Tax=Candidatus Gottesmaniibacteriota TaxID=1752720 RepID=A0A1F5ZL20_9BACT|nr:MAG: preprotein translocase subunit SecE [Candidatus Gottesmanbacteria bacterium RIFCSPHIGHO2_01_FULL_46_14]OGG28648.1 MAG: preprotein translocase subunit SecE [Candidatus Gottesmanbacteria bacterium RIFCSPLOWO2_01_FULL_46_21]